MSMSTQIQSDLDVKGCRAQLYLNDIPVMLLTPEGMGGQRVASEQLIVPGRNRLELLVEPGLTPSIARSGARHLEKPTGEEPKASAKIVRFTIDMLPGETESRPSIAAPAVVAEAKWEWPPAVPDETGKAVFRFPESVVAETELGPGRGRWRWQDAPPLELDDGLRAEVTHFLDEFDAAFRSARMDVLWELSRQQSEDMQRCYSGLTEDFLRTDLARVVDFYRRSAEPSFPRVPERHDFHLVAGGRLLNVVDTDWVPSYRLRDPDDGSEVGVPMLLARVDGNLRIVR